ncbi:MAG: hypothetical protein ACRCW9_09985 [Cetobacterium sp.]
MAKELDVIDANFFELFYRCQRRALISYSNEAKALRHLVFEKKDKTQEFYEREIVQKIIMTSLLYIKENSKLSYQHFVQISKLILKDFLEQKENSFLEAPYKKRSKTTLKEVLLSKVEDRLHQIFNLIKQEDSVFISNGNLEDYLELNYYVKERVERKYKFGTCMRFQNTLFYRVQLPLVLIEENELSVIYFLHDIDYYNPIITNMELALTCFYLNENYQDYILKNFIVYDCTNLKRHCFPINSVNEISVLDELFKIMVLIEYKNVIKSKGKNCKECLNSDACTLEVMTQEKHSEFHVAIRERYGSIGSKKLNNLVKKRLFNDKSLGSNIDE